ncbi:hypothetical protein NE865_03213 [Phthorimaea operculella]|nr:hypothetical protein NE865_03213 [Phthorimaea operculella]
MWLWLLNYFLILAVIFPVRGHIPAYETTPANRIDHYCGLAENCVHDTIPVCGKNGDQTKSFLDICDMLEYGCDTSEIYTHVKDIAGCPVPTPKIR